MCSLGIPLSDINNHPFLESRHAATVTDYDVQFESPYAGGSWDTTAQLSLPRMAQAAVTLARTLAALQYDVWPPAP
jgi:hypothetical protein